MARIFHTVEEMHKIARAALDRGYTSADKDIARKIRNLQSIVLAEDRCRSIAAKADITGNDNRPGILMIMDEIAAKGYQPKPVINILPADIQHDVHLDEANGHEVEIPADAEPVEAEPTAIEAILRTCAKQLVEQFMRYVKEELAAAVQKEFLPAILSASKELKERKQKILIIGLKPQQAGLIDQEFSGLYDLRFVDSGSGHSAITGKLQVDRVIGMTNFMSHSIEDHIKHHPGYKRVSGGMDSLRTELRSLN